MGALEKLLTSPADRQMQMSEVSLHGMDDLAALTPRYKRLRADLVGDQLATHVCPAELEDGSFVVFVTPTHQGSDVVPVVKNKLKGLTSEPPRVLLMSPTLLLTLSRDSVGTGSGGRSRERSALISAFFDIVEWGIANEASDIHMNQATHEAESHVAFTIMGRYVKPARFRMPTSRLQEIINLAWMEVSGGEGAVFDGRIEQQGRVRETVRHVPVMLRWASLACDTGPSVCLRILRLDRTIEGLTLAQLGYLPSQIAMFERAQRAEGGSIVLAGVVGSGKSTTNACLLHAIPTTRKVITLEDPVEYVIPNALQNTITRSLHGNEGDAFASKLKTVKRSAMNDLLIGEIRDRETGRAWMDLTTSGTNVYTTVHAGGAALIPDRMASDFIGISRDLLATPGILKLLVYQALLPTLCDCALPASSLLAGGPGLDGIEHDGAYWRHYFARIERLYGIGSDRLRVRNVAGCPHCQRAEIPELNGINGRTVVAEMIEPGIDAAILRAIRTNDPLTIMDLSRQTRTAAFDDADMTGKSAMECAIYKASQGTIDPREIEPRFEAFETVELKQKRRPS